MSEKSAAMTERPWTRGPWARRLWAEQWLVEAKCDICDHPEALCLATVHYTGGGDPDHPDKAAANAALIASAPDLYEALEALHDDCVEYSRINNLGGEDNHVLKQARAALARARGETL